MTPFDIGDGLAFPANSCTNTDAGFHMYVCVEYVSIWEQMPGEKPKQKMRIPREEFNKLLDWYLADQGEPVFGCAA